ncbi:hypothetical protein CATRI_00490 [Corynebacterium atrinae]|uniref:ATP-binding protein n=1 Tax=Corynebacterium atrinae TaxID=1336740 RepID=UPI0025B45D32|nr:DUF4143 domain-containing protein [Corynebacterium atrinae]WJY62220.1 hypothetical protein CATRI_00490 [Corynebacterium atrinae]
MTSENRTYVPRILDGLLERYLAVMGAVLIEGPKASGKTATALQHAASTVRLDRDPNAQTTASVLPQQTLKGDVPRLIDEWQVVPDLWNAIRHEVDDRAPRKGQFILTGSSVPNDDVNRHSGAGRIATLQMRPMTLFESGHSTGKASLSELFAGEFAAAAGSDLDLIGVLERMVIGGWPGLLGINVEDAVLVNGAYLDQVCEVDVALVSGRSRDPFMVRRMLASLARNVATEASFQQIASDTGGAEGPLDRETVSVYHSALRRLSLVEDLPAWNTHLRSKAQLRKTPKRLFVDPSLAVAALGAGVQKLLGDLNYTGFLFESLVIRDLRVYAQALGGQVFHYRDSNGLEVDAIVELRDGRWAAFEVKMGTEDSIELAARSLHRFAETVDTAKVGSPVVLAVIVPTGIAYRRPDNILVIPLTAFGP